MPFIKHYHSPLGILEIVANDLALTHILFREAQKKPSKQLDETAESSPIITECMAQLDQYFAGNLKTFNLPLLAQGTDFQRLVWQHLLNIPFGKTFSYLELSRKIGNEKAIRAVGTANGNNPLSIVIPCHRVIGSDGSLIGYAGDLWRKEWLLQHEGSLPKTQQMNLF